MDVIFWSPKFWCPPGYNWSDYSARFSDIYYSLITALALVLLRYVSESLLFKPLGFYLCCKPQTSGHSSSTARRQQQQQGGDVGRTKKTTTSAAKLTTPSVVRKFSETMWRLSFYLALAVFGWFYVLWNKPYLADTMQSLYNYPHHPVTNDEWWYYNIELAFYISLLITQFSDTKRKDFWQMFAHHIVTILLIVLSWACNFHRIGCLVIAIHDIADVPLEGAKLARYCKQQRLADLFFAIFTPVWIYTRCYLLPTRVLYYTTYKALSIIPFFPAYYIFNGLLLLLQLLHIAWTYVILRMVVDAIQNEGMRDLRSDSEEDPHED